jgi:hypothetical protein
LTSTKQTEAATDGSPAHIAGDIADWALGELDLAEEPGLGSWEFGQELADDFGGVGILWRRDLRLGWGVITEVGKGPFGADSLATECVVTDPTGDDIDPTGKAAIAELVKPRENTKEYLLGEVVEAVAARFPNAENAMNAGIKPLHQFAFGTGVSCPHSSNECVPVRIVAIHLVSRPIRCIDARLR